MIFLPSPPIKLPAIKPPKLLARPGNVIFSSSEIEPFRLLSMQTLYFIPCSRANILRQHGISSLSVRIFLSTVAQPVELCDTKSLFRPQLKNSTFIVLILGNNFIWIRRHYHHHIMKYKNGTVSVFCVFWLVTLKRLNWLCMLHEDGYLDESWAKRAISCYVRTTIANVRLCIRGWVFISKHIIIWYHHQ